ncbi:MAG TPA: GntR family transcriptional regulator [Candidatus Binatia bacterium]|nr:GntR family transcriptional regulator [Candidatus Binatia bacterium]
MQIMTALLEKLRHRARRTENLSGQAYRQIKTLILCNEILPGQKLHHQELSERLGVSRTPVREALTRLVQEGYVALLPNRGFTCKEIGLQEANELYQLREALEAFAVEKAIANLTETGVTILSAKVSLYGKDVQKRFTRDRLVCDQDVHLEIAPLSGNQTLAQTLAQVFERIILKRRTDGLYDPARGVAAHQEHLKLLQAIRKRHASDAVRIIRAHIRAGRDNVLADLKQRQAIREWRQTGTAGAI